MNSDKQKLVNLKRRLKSYKTSPKFNVYNRVGATNTRFSAKITTAQKNRTTMKTMRTPPLVDGSFQSLNETPKNTSPKNATPKNAVESPVNQQPPFPNGHQDATTAIGSLNIQNDGGQLTEILQALKKNDNTLTEAVVRLENLAEKQSQMIAEIQGTLNDQSVDIKALQNEARDRRAENRDLYHRIDVIEQRQYASTLIVSGPRIKDHLTKNPNSNSGFVEPETVANIISTTLQLTGDEAIKVSDIKYCRKLASSKIVLEFKQDIPSSIFKNAKNANNQIFISEFLTKTRDEISYNLRKLKNKYPKIIDKVMTRRGRPGIYFQPQLNYPGFCIYDNYVTLAQLEKFLATLQSKNMESERTDSVQQSQILQDVVHQDLVHQDVVHRNVVHQDVTNRTRSF